MMPLPSIFMSTIFLLLSLGSISQALSQIPNFGPLQDIIRNVDKANSTGKPPSPSLPVSPNTPSSDSANSARSPQLPCLSKICLGDSILQHINTVVWIDFSEKIHQRVYGPQSSLVRLDSGGAQLLKKEPEKIKYEVKDVLAWIIKYVKGLPEQDRLKLAGYLHTDLADQGLFSLLAERKPIFCRRKTEGFIARFLSESGYPTEASILPNDKGEYIITGLERLYPTNDRIASEKLISQVLQQFPYLKYRGEPVDTSWGLARFNYTGHGDSLWFRLNLKGGGYDEKSLSRQKACGVPNPSVD